MISDQEASARKNRSIGYLCAALSAVLFGLMPLFTKTAYQYGSNAHTVAFMRFFYTALVCGILLFLMPGASFSIRSKEVKWMALLGIFYAFMAALLYESYRHMDSGLATAVHFSYPVVVMLLSVVILHVRLSRMQVFCAAACMCGIALMTQTEGAVSLPGVALAFFSGVSLALYVVFLTKSGLKNMPMLKLVFWLSLFTAVYLFLFSMAGGTLLLRLPWQAHVAQLLQAICCTMLAMALFQKSVAMIGGVRTSLLATFEPIVSVLTGVLVFHEALTLRPACGVAIILFSVVMLVRTDR